MKILLHTLDHGVGHQILDAWQAYRQHLDHYDNHTQYFLKDKNDQIEFSHYDFTILLDYMGNNVAQYNVDCYDIVLLCNGGEPLTVASPLIKEMLSNKNNVYMICNSFLSIDIDQTLKSKIIWFPMDVFLCRELWTKHFYPQYFDAIKFNNLKRQPSIVAIMGASRAHRNYFFDKLHATIPKLHVHQKFNIGCTSTLDGQWETTEDTCFREHVNHLYKSDFNKPAKGDSFEDSKVTIGINGRFGHYPQGYFLMPLYYEKSCVIFPETTWLNNELCLTEKSLKCFFSGSIPFPIGGANVNKLYNQLGFYTAWNLLPKQLQTFDTITDHLLRTQKTLDAVQWLYEHSEIFLSDQFDELVQNNKNNFLEAQFDSIATLDFDKLLTKHCRDLEL